MAAATTADGGRMENVPRSVNFDQLQQVRDIGPLVFQAVVEEDYEGMAKLFATHARSSLCSYMSIKSRWARQQENMAKSGKLLVEETMSLPLLVSSIRV